MFLEQLSGIDHSGDGCDVDIGLVALAFRSCQCSIKYIDVGVSQLLDPCCEHTPDCTAATPTNIAVYQGKGLAQSGGSGCPLDWSGPPRMLADRVRPGPPT
jgi:hypothetical protein